MLPGHQRKSHASQMVLRYCRERQSYPAIYVTIIKMSKRQHVSNKKEVIHFIVGISTRKDGTRMMARYRYQNQKRNFRRTYTHKNGLQTTAVVSVETSFSCRCRAAYWWPNMGHLLTNLSHGNIGCQISCMATSAPTRSNFRMTFLNEKCNKHNRSCCGKKSITVTQ